MSRLKASDICIGETAFFDRPPKYEVRPQGGRQLIESGEFGSVRRERGGFRLLSDLDHETPTEHFVTESELNDAEIKLSRPTLVGKVYRGLSRIIA